jgi:hypothetical protein
VKTRARRWSCALLIGLALASSPSPVDAWDPSTTHLGVLESAVTRSALHLRWMDASGLERGLFSPLRLDPHRLAPDELRLLQLAMRSAHADSGAVPLGGPGACPPASAPAVTQMFCVDRDVWEHSALGWLRLGMLAEVSPSARHIHHFLDREEPDAEVWADRELPAVVLRARQARTNGEPRVGVVTRTNFDGRAPTALTWFEDPDDLLAPPQTYQHLARASLAETRAERDHELALALIGVGALLHVIQDLSVPAHARGDATAFFAPLSPSAGDRGLPLQEFVRVEYGRGDLPGVPRALPNTAPLGEPLAQTLVGHLLGEGSYPGLASLAARHFFSESSVPAPAYLDASLSPQEAAAALLGADHHLAPDEVDGALLSPWPAEQGYLLSPTGRALAAFDTDVEGRIRPYLDDTCYREQAATLLPAAAAVTSSVLDLLWPAWPQTARNGDAIVLTLPDWASAELTVMVEDAGGRRRTIDRHTLTVAGQSRIGLDPLELGEGERVFLVLEAARTQGPPIVLEQLLEAVLEQPVEAPIEVAPIEVVPLEVREPEVERIAGPDELPPDPEAPDPEAPVPPEPVPVPEPVPEPEPPEPAPEPVPEAPAPD